MLIMPQALVKWCLVQLDEHLKSSKGEATAQGLHSLNTHPGAALKCLAKELRCAELLTLSSSSCKMGVPASAGREGWEGRCLSGSCLWTSLRAPLQHRNHTRCVHRSYPKWYVLDKHTYVEG